MRRAGRPELVAALLAAALLAGGCSWFVRTQGFRYDRVERAPKAKAHPMPILAQEPQGRPYVVIGMVQAEARQIEGIGERELKEGLRREARRMGGAGRGAGRSACGRLRAAPLRTALMRAPGRRTMARR